MNISSMTGKRDEKSAVSWIDYKKANDMVSQSWILDCLKMYKMYDEVIKFIENTIENWRVRIKPGEKKASQRWKSQVG